MLHSTYIISSSLQPFRVPQNQILFISVNKSKVKVRFHCFMYDSHTYYHIPSKAVGGIPLSHLSVTVTRQYFFCGSFLLFMFGFCLVFLHWAHLLGKGLYLYDDTLQ